MPFVAVVVSDVLEMRDVPKHNVLPVDVLAVDVLPEFIVVGRSQCSFLLPDVVR